METKQTAVEYLQRVYFKTGMLYRTDFEKAKQMEREQIEKSFMEGTKMDNINDELSARFNSCIYYGENYGGQDE
jgi:hypothetical protein